MNRLYYLFNSVTREQDAQPSIQSAGQPAYTEYYSFVKFAEDEQQGQKTCVKLINWK